MTILLVKFNLLERLFGECWIFAPHKGYWGRGYWFGLLLPCIFATSVPYTFLPIKQTSKASKGRPLYEQQDSSLNHEVE
jgi:hypothetical protein